ncbi:Protein of unknown function [Cotesia congregata]|uniref:Uncharacterized protein n=1 Tax=Cotesia congregata TaxID=51543 RepID=A0A8J2HKR3_COTCN|nr:Protein of unknown function [Cotesia congregata]
MAGRNKPTSLHTTARRLVRSIRVHAGRFLSLCLLYLFSLYVREFLARFSRPFALKRKESLPHSSTVMCYIILYITAAATPNLDGLPHDDFKCKILVLNFKEEKNSKAPSSLSDPALAYQSIGPGSSPAYTNEYFQYLSVLFFSPQEIKRVLISKVYPLP